jgi:hypothetical protein
MVELGWRKTCPIRDKRGDIRGARVAGMEREKEEASGEGHK